MPPKKRRIPKNRRLERRVTKTVKETKGQRFDCPRCLSTVPCDPCKRGTE